MNFPPELGDRFFLRQLLEFGSRRFVLVVVPVDPCRKSFTLPALPPPLRHIDQSKRIPENYLNNRIPVGNVLTTATTID